MVRPTCITWVSGLCLLEKALEVFGVGELRALESRSGGVLARLGVVERASDHPSDLLLHLPLGVDDTDGDEK